MSALTVDIKPMLSNLNLKSMNKKYIFAAVLIFFFLSSKIMLVIIPVIIYLLYNLYNKNNKNQEVRDKKILKYLKKISKNK